MTLKICALVIGLAAFVVAFDVRREGAASAQWRLLDLAIGAVSALVVAQLFLFAAAQ